MPEPVDIKALARTLNRSVRQLRRDFASGDAPVLRRGGRGRGRADLYDITAIEAWLRSRSAPQPHDALRILACEIPEIISSAMYSAFTAIEGPHKRSAAGVLAGAWYVATVAVLDRMRQDAPEIPEVSTVPDKIGALRHILE